ncbi:hypothetical protein AUR64_11610 [Haloprofundus marisrubri]|uniref:Uncharacterized protein n=1 Tax=Haloprofundus marisrubri TaxID=1514971 RepID=A0A0W1RAC5_9EURY|nr:hypothetical protein [Haloprofundus marisrubri]KTG10224.1 hypothetical protein AUR64_11610 [Haloprofundus marisrubri]
MVLPRPTQYLVWKLSAGLAFGVFLAVASVGIEYPRLFLPAAVGGMLAAVVVFGGIRAVT